MNRALVIANQRMVISLHLGIPAQERILHHNNLIAMLKYFS